MKLLPILYSFRRCPYAMRARLAIKVANIEVEIREILLREKAPELIEISPKATVPVLVDCDASVHDESLDIMIWALAKNDPERWLIPDCGTPGEMHQLIERCEEEFKPRLDRYKYASRYGDVDVQQERDRANEFLWHLEERLVKQNYLFGSRKSLADMAIVTFVRQFANVDRQWFDQCEWRNLDRWLVEFLGSDIFSQIMDKYQFWQRGDEPITFG